MSLELLPAYTPEVLPTYDLTPTTSCSTRPTTPTSPLTLLARPQNHSTYHYVSERMELDLGPRRWGTRLPCYGRAGLVEGTINIRSFKHVERIVVRLLGKVITSHIINHIPTVSQTHAVINKSVELWTSSGPSSSSKLVPTQFPFSFTLAEENQELPPSSSIELRRANAHVVYAVRVDMYRRGMHMHETLQTEILHLPRTTSPYTKPFVPTNDPHNEKRRRMSPSEWYHVPSSSPSLLIPSLLRYPSGHAIPFALCNISEGELVPEVELVRTKMIQTRAGLVKKSEIISRGQIEERALDQIRYGIVQTGKPGKEASWEIEKIGHVRYSVVFGDVTQPIELVSHEWRGENATSLPSINSEVTGRHALHLINMRA